MNASPVTAPIDLSVEYEQLRGTRRIIGRQPQRLLVDRGMAEWMRVAVDLLPPIPLSPVSTLTEASGSSTAAADAPLLAEWPATAVGDLVGVLADVCLAALGSGTVQVGVDGPRAAAPGLVASPGGSLQHQGGFV